MSGRLIALDKQPDVRPFGVGGTWRCLFAKCMLKVTGTKATTACQNDQLFAKLKAAIYRAIHDVQAIWGANLSMEDWDFLLVDAKNVLNKINCFGMLWTVHHFWPPVYIFNLIVIVPGHRSSCGTGMVRPVSCTVWRV